MEILRGRCRVRGFLLRIADLLSDGRHACSFVITWWGISLRRIQNCRWRKNQLLRVRLDKMLVNDMIGD